MAQTNFSYSAADRGTALRQQTGFLPFTSSQRSVIDVDRREVSVEESALRREMNSLPGRSSHVVTEGGARVASLLGGVKPLKDSPDLGPANEAQMVDSIKKSALFMGLFNGHRDRDPFVPSTSIAGAGMASEVNRKDWNKSASMDDRQNKLDLKTLEAMMGVSAKSQDKNKTPNKGEMDIEKAADKQLQKVEEAFNKAIPTSLQHGYGKAPLDNVKLDKQQIMTEAGVDKKQLAGVDGKNAADAQKNAQDAMAKMQKVVAESQYNFKADTIEGAKLERNGATKDENPAAKEAAQSMNGVSANTGHKIRGSNPELRAEMAAAHNSSFQKAPAAAPAVKVDAPGKSMAA